MSSTLNYRHCFHAKQSLLRLLPYYIEAERRLQIKSGMEISKRVVFGITLNSRVFLSILQRYLPFYFQRAGEVEKGFSECDYCFTVNRVRGRQIQPFLLTGFVFQLYLFFFFFSDGNLFSATVADFSSMDPIIYKEQLQTEQYDSLSLNGKGSMIQHYYQPASCVRH